MFFKFIIVVSWAAFVQAYPLSLCPKNWDPVPCHCQEGLPNPSLSCTEPSLTTDDLKLIFQRLPYPTRFQKLMIKDTKVESFSRGMFGNFTFLSASFENNLLNTVDKDAFEGFAEQIEYIIFKGNQLSNFDFRSTHKMKGLYMITITEDSHFTSIPDDAFADNPRLTSIYLQRNNIQTIGKRAFEKLPGVHNIDLYENKITSLDEYSLSVNTILSKPTLNLTNNLLTASMIHPTAFAKLTPRQLELRYNRLTLLPEALFKSVLDFQSYAYPAMFVTEGKTDVTGNIFKCNHLLKWLVDKPPDYKKHVVGFKCTNGKTLNELNVDDLH